MDEWLQLALTSLGTFGASSGFWAYVQHKDRTKSAMARLLMGIAYNHLTERGIEYLERGEVTKDEFEEYNKFFYEPYRELGGNGVAESIASRVARLPIRSHSRYDEIFQNEEISNNVRIVSQWNNQAPAE